MPLVGQDNVSQNDLCQFCFRHHLDQTDCSSACVGVFSTILICLKITDGKFGKELKYIEILRIRFQYTYGIATNHQSIIYVPFFPHNRLFAPPHEL